MAAGVFAQYKFVAGYADGFRRHDLVTQRVGDNAVLVNAGLVREGIASDNRLIRLRREADDLRKQAARGINLPGIDASLKRKLRLAHIQHHRDLFQRRVTRALPDSIDGALHLACAGVDGGDGVCHGQTKIVMAVDGDGHVLDALYSLPDCTDYRRELVRDGVADRVRDVDGRRAGIDGGLHELAEKIKIGAGGVFRRELYVMAERFGVSHSAVYLFQRLIARNFQLACQVQIRAGEKHMDSWATGASQRSPRPANIGFAGASQPGDDRTRKLG